MELNGFSVQILGADYALQPETRENYVPLNHGSTYKIHLVNRFRFGARRCNVDIEIDGKNVGTWRMNPFSEATLERPAHDDGLFTFYRLGTSEAEASELSKNDKLGLITVTFIPEKIEEVVQRISRVEGGRGACGQGMGNPYDHLGLECSDGSKGFGAGGTGLSGRSSQRFGIAQKMPLDESWKTVINLRLVAHFQSSPRPLTPINSTPIPPPVA